MARPMHRPTGRPDPTAVRRPDGADDHERDHRVAGPGRAHVDRAEPDAGERVDERGGEHGGDAHGRSADAPQEIPARGWKDVAVRVKDEAKEDNITLLSAGIAFWALLSAFPAMAAAVSIYGLVASPDDVRRLVDGLTGNVPPEAKQLLSDQLDQLVRSSGTGLGLGVVVGILLALWGASAAMKHLQVALSGIYDEHESRSYVKLRLRAIVMTIAGIVFLGVTLTLLTFGPTWVGEHLGDAAGTVASVLRWPVLGLIMIVGLAAVYRWSPDRDEPKWRWVSWGAAVATVVWLVASALFSLYVSHAGSYNKTYGTMAGVVVLMLWLFLTALCVLLGGEVNAELEHQTARDTTRGRPEPLGARDAYVADTVGRAAP